MTKQITEAELQPAERPGDGWYIIEVAGRYWNRTTDDIRVVQVLTPAVLAAIAAAGVPPEGLPIDRDHLSLDHDNSTEAMGWVRELAMCGDALAARIEWTSLGRPLIQGKVYKHFSTVYPLPDVGRAANGVEVQPERLGGLALTNQPNNGGQPAISNRAAAAGSFGVANRAAAAGSFGVASRKTSGGGYPSRPTQEEKTTQETEMNPEILKALGLPEDATDQEVIEKIHSLTQTAEDAQAAAQEAAEAEAEQVVETEQSVANTELEPEEKQECKEQILANRAHGIKYTRLLCNSKRNAAGAQPRRYQGKAPNAPGLVANRRDVTREQRVANRANELCAQAKAQGLKPNFWAMKVQAEREIGKECK